MFLGSFICICGRGEFRHTRMSCLLSMDLKFLTEHRDPTRHEESMRSNGTRLPWCQVSHLSFRQNIWPLVYPSNGVVRVLEGILQQILRPSQGSAKVKRHLDALLHRTTTDIEVGKQTTQRAKSREPSRSAKADGRKPWITHGHRFSFRESHPELGF